MQCTWWWKGACMRSDLIVPVTRTLYGLKGVAVFGSKIWNRLPVVLRECKTIESFTRNYWKLYNKVTGLFRPWTYIINNDTSWIDLWLVWDPARNRVCWQITRLNGLVVALVVTNHYTNSLHQRSIPWVSSWLVVLVLPVHSATLHWSNIWGIVWNSMGNLTILVITYTWKSLAFSPQVSEAEQV